MSETLILQMERDGYRIALGPNGLSLSMLRTFDQRDEREYTRAIVIPLEELQAVGDLVFDFHKRGAELGIWPAPE